MSDRRFLATSACCARFTIRKGRTRQSRPFPSDLRNHRLGGVVGKFAPAVSSLALTTRISRSAHGRDCSAKCARDRQFLPDEEQKKTARKGAVQGALRREARGKPLACNTYRKRDRIAEGAWLAIDSACMPSCCLVCNAVKLALSFAISALTKFPMPCVNESERSNTKVN